MENVNAETKPISLEHPLHYSASVNGEVHGPLDGRDRWTVVLAGLDSPNGQRLNILEAMVQSRTTIDARCSVLRNPKFGDVFHGPVRRRDDQIPEQQPFASVERDRRA
jgi:hypothetical protein